jgi:hypothetical protein
VGVEQKTDAKLTAGDIRGLSPGHIEDLVEQGLLTQAIADQALAEQDSQQQQKFQADTEHRHEEDDAQHEKRKSEEAWLEQMSQSYQQEYHHLMDTYDRDEDQYKDIKTEAEKLKERFEDKVRAAYLFGVRLPDGRLAFFDRQQNAFVDSSLQPLKEDEARQAAEDFKQLSPHEQKANACYADACHAYENADGISQAADTGIDQIEKDKVTLRNSDGSISEEQLKNLGAADRARVKNLSQRLGNAEQADVDLDAALNGDGENAKTASSFDSDSMESESKAPQSKTSFASLIDGDANGKTSASFNAVAPGTVSADDLSAPKPAVQPGRSSSAPGF